MTGVLTPLATPRLLYTNKEYSKAVEAVQSLLPVTSNPAALSEAHLLLAKCYKGLGELKLSISSCNSAIQHNSKWKEPFLYRSACFQALHTSFTETAGDREENIARDRAEADIIGTASGATRATKQFHINIIILLLLYTAAVTGCVAVDWTCEPTDLTAKKDSPARRLLGRRDKEQVLVTRLDQALKLAQDGQTIFIEPGNNNITTSKPLRFRQKRF